MSQTPSPLINDFGQPVGPSLEGWSPPAMPSDAPMQGRLCRLERFDAARHLQPLFDAYAPDDGRMWTYLPWGPFADADAMHDSILRTPDFQRFVILDGLSGAALGQASYMRHALDAGSVEVGAVIFSPSLRRATAATEAMQLMMRRAFEAGYRRYEWKGDALNAASWAAALRLGFRFEGVFRQERVIRGRNRDTAWFSVIDSEWPALARAHARWLDPENFDPAGGQRQRLGELVSLERGEAAGAPRST